MRRALPLLVVLILLSAGVASAEGGDVNGDGRVDNQDVQLIEDYLAGNVLLQDAQIAAADADRDGKITARDRDLLNRRLAGLKASADRSAVDLQSADSGVVIDRQTGQPLANVEVALPDEGITVRTDAQGRFRLPQTSSGKILTARASNYAPVAVTTRDQGRGFQLALDRIGPRLRVLDDGLYHLGDNNYDARSAGAGQFRLAALGVFYERPFELGTVPTGDLRLRIGSLIGLDTYQSVLAGQSRLALTSQRQLRDGLRISLNGYLVHQQFLNGDNIVVVLPRWMLRRGTNLLRLETARSSPSAATVFDPGNLLGAFGRLGLPTAQVPWGDYDDIEFAHLVLEEPDPRPSAVQAP